MVDHFLHGFQLCKVPYITDVSVNPHYGPTKETKGPWNTFLFKVFYLLLYVYRQ